MGGDNYWQIIPYFTFHPMYISPFVPLKRHERAFLRGYQLDPCGVSAGRGEMRRPIKKENEHMFKLYVVKNKKKILKVKTKSFSNLQAFLYSLRKQGYFCEVEYPRREQ